MLSALFIIFFIRLLPTSADHTFVKGINTSSSLEGRIVGGVPIGIQDAPYQLSFQYQGEHFCGASIIGIKWALTAAHCSNLVRNKWVENLQMKAGSSRTDSGGVSYPLQSVHIHWRFNINTLDYDVSVVSLARSFVEGATIRRIPLAPMNFNVVAGDPLIVTGWGTMGEFFSASSSVLQMVEITAVSRSACKKKFGGENGQITNRMFCAGDRRKDTCRGDSGGPLRSHSGYQVGIVSWGVGCARERYPGIYTSIPSPEIRGYIKKMTGI